MNWMRVVIACLLLAATPLHGVAMPLGCCPPTAGSHDHPASQHAGQSHGTHPHLDEHDSPCSPFACAQHCAHVTTLASASQAPAAVRLDAFHPAPAPAHPPLSTPSPHDRPPIVLIG